MTPRREENASLREVEIGPSVRRALDQLEAVDITFHDPVTVG
jgi:hypothetical protein